MYRTGILAAALAASCLVTAQAGVFGAIGIGIGSGGGVGGYIGTDFERDGYRPEVQRSELPRAGRKALKEAHIDWERVGTAAYETTWERPAQELADGLVQALRKAGYQVDLRREGASDKAMYRIRYVPPVGRDRFMPLDLQVLLPTQVLIYEAKGKTRLLFYDMGFLAEVQHNRQEKEGRQLLEELIDILVQL